MIWRHDRRGTYSVKSCSDVLDLVLLAENSPIQSYVWKVLAPQKVEGFLWLAVLNKLNTKDSICRKGITDAATNVCPFSHSSTETAAHLFLHGLKVWKLWCWIYSWWECERVVPRSVYDLFTNWNY